MTDLNRASIYVPITSITKADSGRTRIVTGVAGSDILDYDGQRASYDWLKRELSSWFKVGNMRQDHRPGGVGKGLTLEFDDKARKATVVSKAVDQDTITKLDEQVLNGYSWGAKSVPGNPIRIRKDAGGVEWIESGKIVEVSYVDHPANPDCFVSLVKSAGKRGLQRSAILGDLAAGDIPGGQDYDAILKALLSDIAKRDVSAAERDRLGEQGHAIDTGQDHPSYPINNPGDLENAIEAYGRANPEDRAKLRRHIISEARRLGHPEMVPDDWKSVDGIVKQAQCMCCDDCGPDCQGDCCDECTMGPQKAAAPGPVGILAGVGKLLAEEPDAEFRGFLAKLAGAVEGWTKAEGVSVDVGTYAQLATLSKAAAEPDLGKRRTFYSGQNRAAVEQAMQRLHQELGLFMEGAAATDADKDQRDSTLTGQDAPAAGDQPGGPGTAPGDGNPGDGNLAYDPEMVRDGDPAIRTPDGERDGRAQGEAGVHTRPPAGDAPGSGPGDQGKGQAPPAKGREPDPQQAQQSPSKAAKRLRKLESELDELRKAAAAAPSAPPAIALQQHLGDGKRPKGGASKALRAELARTTAAVQALVAKPAGDQTRPADTEAAVQALLRSSEKRMRRILREQAAAGTAPAQDEAVKGLREEIKELGVELHKSLEGQRAAAGTEEAAAATRRLEKRLSKRLRRMRERLDKAAVAAPPPNPLEAQIAELRAVIAGQATKGATPDTQNSDATLLLMADLTRAAFDQARKDSTEQATWLGKRVKRAERRLRKAAAADSKRLEKVAQEVNDLGRLPHPGGPHVARPTDKTFPINDSIERMLPPADLKKAEVLGKMAESTDRGVAEWAREQLKSLGAEVRG